jgi:hypothetical protein
MSDDHDISRIRTDDLTIDDLAAGWQPGPEDEVLVRGLAAYRDTARAKQTIEVPAQPDLLGYAAILCFVLAALGFAASFIMALWMMPAYGWPLLVSLCSNLLLIVAVGIGVFTTNR